MSNWRITGKCLNQIDLANELTIWLNKVKHGVRLFREGPTLNEFQWGNAPFLTAAELSKVWGMRLFCAEYEVYARRLGYDADEPWQVRIAAQENHLSGGEELTFGGEETVLLLGEALGDGDSFIQKPNRYRRARIHYPGVAWQPKQHCGLIATRYLPPGGHAIVCWKELRPVQLTTHSTQQTEEVSTP